MAWFRNEYECYRCGDKWEDEWSCTCDDECPSCGARHASPIDSTDLTLIIDDTGDGFAVLRSADDAEDHPDYYEVFRALSREYAQFYLTSEQSRPLDMEPNSLIG